MVDELYLGPLRGREPGLEDACDGIMFNALVQPRAGTLPLASIAAWFRGDDPVAAWQDEADRLGWRVFAEACDGEVPRRLAAALAAEAGGPAWADAMAPLAEWLRAAAACTAPGIEDEVPEFLDAARREATFALRALRCYQDARPVARIDASGRGRAAPQDEDGSMAHIPRVVHEWKELRRGRPQVLGARLSTRVAFRPSSTGGMVMGPGSVREDESAVDAIVRATLAVTETMPWAGAVQVFADGTEVPVADDGSFAVDPDAVVLVRSNGAATRVTVPCEPPLDERRV
jgi:hypothetical protein